jgi:hypothetical protein
MRKLTTMLVASLAFTAVAAAPVAAGDKHQLIRDSAYIEFFYLDPAGDVTYVLTTGPKIGEGWCTEENSEPRDRVSQLKPDGTWTSRVHQQGVRTWLYDTSAYPNGFAFVDAACAAAVGGGDVPEPEAEGTGWLGGTWTGQPELLDEELNLAPGVSVTNKAVAHLTMADGSRVNALGTASYTVNPDGSLDLRRASLVVAP